MDCLGGSYFDDVVHAVRTFEPGDEAHIMDLFEAHVAVAQVLTPTLDATRERTEVTKTWHGPIASGTNRREKRITSTARSPSTKRRWRSHRRTSPPATTWR